MRHETQTSILPLVGWVQRQETIIMGVSVGHGCQITHGSGGRITKPFDSSPVVMHTLSAGGGGGDAQNDSRAYKGQLGFIHFTDQHRLPRFVHIATNAERKLVAERILVLNGVALVEICGTILLVAPGSLTEIAPGVPHTWNACPAGVVLPDGHVFDGTFLMIFEYDDVTGFFLYEGTEPLGSVDAYVEYEGDLELIRFPKLTTAQVVECGYVWDSSIRHDLKISGG